MHLSENIKVDQCIANIETLTNRLRTQNWYHELSEQERWWNCTKTLRHASKGTCTGAWPMDQSALRGVQTHGLDRHAFHQRIAEFVEEHQRWEVRGRMVLRQRVAQLNMSLMMPWRKLQCHLYVFNRSFKDEELDLSSLAILCTPNLWERLKSFKPVWITKELGWRKWHVSLSNSQLTLATHLKCVCARCEQKEVIRNLAQKAEALRSGTHLESALLGNNATSEHVPSDNSAPIVLEIEDLKTKVARLMERADQQNRDMSNSGPVMHPITGRCPH